MSMGLCGVAKVPDTDTVTAALVEALLSCLRTRPCVAYVLRDHRKALEKPVVGSLRCMPGS